MSNDTPLTPDSLAALRARFDAQSRKAQAYYTVMHEIRRIVGSEEAASSWMESPLAAFDGQSPAQLVAGGSEHALLEHVRALKPGAAR
jgi:uncharacterized protein (DUF2384 family)